MTAVVDQPKAVGGRPGATAAAAAVEGQPTAVGLDTFDKTEEFFPGRC